MKKTPVFIFSAILTSASLYAIGENRPIIQTKYTADPAPIVINDTIFLYTSHDEDDAQAYGFKMKNWLLFTSTDMLNWTDNGAVASLEDFKWYDGDNGAWAIQVVERNGKYYMYCPIHGHGIGVLVSDSPYGPFKDPIGKPLVWQREHWDDIDPTVFIDDDGQAYMYWGNPNLYCIKLNNDMISYSGEIMKMPHIDDYQEGPWFYKRNGHYYLAFASTCCPEGIGYAMSDSPTGPWTYKGHIMNHTPRTRGNHPGIIDYKGKSYVFGQSYDILRIETQDHHERRNVEAAEMHYNSDGTIQEVVYWRDAPLNQIHFHNPYQKTEAETMAWGYGLKVKKTDLRTSVLTNINNGETLTVAGVDFGKGAKKFSAAIASEKEGNAIEIHLDSENGPIVGILEVKPGKTSDKFSLQSCKVKGAKGVHDLVFKFIGTQSDSDLMEIDYWQFK